MQLIERHACIITENEEIEYLYSFKNFPVHMGVTEKTQDEDLIADMTFMIDKKSGMIQLSKLVPLEFLYIDEHYNSVGVGWEKHHKAFALFIYKQKPKSIFEIGGARGILEKCYAEIDKRIPWTILEPTPNPVEGCKAEYIKGFFDENYHMPHHYEAIIHSHTLEHIYEPKVFMKQVSKNMNDGSLMFFSIPNLRRMLEKKYTNVLNFEHTYFCIEPYVEFLLAINGFIVIDKEYFGDDHSIFYATKKAKNISIPVLDKSLYNKNKKLYLDYIDAHKILVENLNKRILNEHQDRPIYLFGAHVYSQFLLAFGLDMNRIICILDNDIIKQGKRLCGTPFKVESPKVLKDKIDPIVILRAGTHCTEIKADILKNINSSVEFWE